MPKTVFERVHLRAEGDAKEMKRKSALLLICIIGISIVFSAAGFPKLFHQQEKPFIPGTPEDVVEPVYKLILPGHISESSAVEKTYYDALSAIADSSEWEAVPEVEYLESLQEVCADAPGVFAFAFSAIRRSRIQSRY